MKLDQVTTLIHSHAEEFDPSLAITTMKTGKNWPRPEYMTDEYNIAVIKVLVGNCSQDETAKLLSLLADATTTRSDLCHELQLLKHKSSVWEDLVKEFVLTDSEIMQTWSDNALRASTAGTWMHAMFEHVLNGFDVIPKSLHEELSMCLRFLSDTVNEFPKLRIFRTEWTIYAIDEDVAGSIDAVFVDQEDDKLVLVDWKRSKKLPEKYNGYGKLMSGPLSSVPDCQGEHYRLQLNMYKWILTKYYEKDIKSMMVVSTAANATKEPFVDLVPDMQETVGKLMSVRRDQRKQSKAHSPTFHQMESEDEDLHADGAVWGNQCPSEPVARSQAALQGEGPQELPATVPFRVVHSTDQASQLERDDDEEVRQLMSQLHNMLDEHVPPAAKKRRLLPGAEASAQQFADTFALCSKKISSVLSTYDPDVKQDRSYIRVQTESMLNTLAARFPDTSEELRRIIAVAAAIAEGRVPPKPMLADAAALSWMIEGGRHMRVHKGFLYIYNDDGSFLPFSGIPPEAVLHRLGSFFTILEGVFRRLRPSVRKDGDSVANAVVADKQNYVSDSDFFLACRQAAARRPNSIQVENRLDDPEPADDVMAVAANRQDQDSSGSWTTDKADDVFKLAFCLKHEFMHTRMISLIVEWCETEDQRQPAICYDDICFAYDKADSSLSITPVPKGPFNNCYVYVPHSLLDPVLQCVEEKLHRFYRQTFWANHNVFVCCQAALAIAKRGYNVDRCFIGISPGGVGQSLYSLHLAEMYKHNHCLFDPNLWYMEEEIRKQVETLARCFIITGQEAPESSKKLHTDLYKKTMSGDGIMGRKPYGYTTRMFSIVGWKRLEVNRLMKFVGVHLGNFNSMLRRAFVWKVKARFVAKKFLERYPDHELDGIFESDPTLAKFFLMSQASIAGLRIQWAFEAEHSLEECYQIIEDYVNGGDMYLTEDSMRLACDLPIRQRHEQTEAGLAAVIATEEDSEKNQDAEASSWTRLQEFLIKKLLESGSETLTYHQFKAMSFKDVQVPNLPKDNLWSKLIPEDLMVEGIIKHKTSKKKSGAYIPKIKFDQTLQEVCKKNPDEQQMIFTEKYDVAKLRDYAYKHLSRAKNAETFREYYAAVLKALRSPQKAKAGRKTAATADLIRKTQAKLDKLASHEDDVQRMLGSKRRLKEKTSGDDIADVREVQGQVIKQVEYHYSEEVQLSVQGRKYSHAGNAQTSSRRLQAIILDGHTMDLDISNCCVSILHQLLEKLKPKPPLPDELKTFLHELLTQRESVIEKLGLNFSEGKEAINKVLNGGNPPDSCKDNETAKKLQRLSLYCRWIACNLLHEDYLSLAENVTKTFPSATIFSLMWTCVEDWILDVWAAHVSKIKPDHVSLHFDGLRVSTDVIPDVDAFTKDCSAHISQETTFNVKIVRKTHKTVLQSIRQACESESSISTMPPILTEDGNCVPCAMWHAFASIRSGVEAMLKKEAPQEGDRAAKHRKYGETAQALGITLSCCDGLPPPAVKSFILHSENAGRPHCVAVQLSADCSYASVFDGSTYRRLPYNSFRNAVCVGFDVPTVATFWQAKSKDEQKVEAILLDLQAGAHDDDMSSDEESEDFTRRCSSAVILLDEDDTLCVSDGILDAMSEEVADVMSDLSKKSYRTEGRTVCPFCPFRSFKQLRQLRTHITKHHTRKNQYICSGTKQTKVVLALYDFAASQQTVQEKYLRESCQILRSTITPALSCSLSHIDKHIRLVLKASGPVYVNLDSIGKTENVRRVRNMYYDHTFADLAVQEMIMQHAQESWPPLLFHSSASSLV